MKMDNKAASGQSLIDKSRLVDESGWKIRTVAMATRWEFILLVYFNYQFNNLHYILKRIILPKKNGEILTH